mmetsp:Transcript_31535/g.48217  ORF Transcript_31535/g.48217 Transcript_31535/m.48217 type:complete len:114 (-) Transcript_31535:203-544(-)
MSAPPTNLTTGIFQDQSAGGGFSGGSTSAFGFGAKPEASKPMGSLFSFPSAGGAPPQKGSDAKPTMTFKPSAPANTGFGGNSNPTKPPTPKVVPAPPKKASIAASKAAPQTQI